MIKKIIISLLSKKMKLQLINICSIEAAKINISGLTVIAGHNDTGKSSIGKILFCIVNAIKRKTDLLQHLNRRFEDVYKKFEEDSVSESLLTTIKDLSAEFLGNIHEKNEIYNSKSDIKNFVGKEINRISGIINKTESIKHNYFTNIYNEIIDLIENGIDDKTALNETLQRYFTSVFDNEISNKFKKNEDGLISINENEENVFEIKIRDNEIKNLSLNSALKFSDAIFIESPILLNYSNVFQQSKTAVELVTQQKRIEKLYEPYIPEYTKNFTAKLKQKPISDINNIFKEIDDDIKKIINGNLVFDDKNNDFIFEKNGEKFKTLNISNGVKYFGILQLLIRNNFINPQSLLILDEPETNMHPAWQIKFAEILVNLVKKANINIVLTSHSPYFIEALETFGNINEIKNKTNFYLCDFVDNLNIEIKCINDDLEPIYKKLSEPFSELEMIDFESKL